ncbi:MAG: haloacid dehalogenase-like hydrolase [Chlamydiia bacterium]|nr:haloacid dehalogenase-like hydrolase [Chlamydiia bacterium]
MAVRAFFLAAFYFSAALFAKEPLSLWNEGAAKQKILAFVKDVEKIPVEDRIAVFDQDGTLWVEKPLYTQLYFALDKGKVSPERAESMTPQEIEKLVAASFSGMTVEAYRKEVSEWLKKAKHPRFNRPFLELVYTPMLELIKLLKEHKFKVYIVSGGGQEFIRSYAKDVYGLPPEQIIGSAGKLKYKDKKLLKLPDVLFIDDKAGKPEAISLMIGKRPYAAFGNSTGDKEMLEWNQGLSLLVHHDDAVREYSYGENSKIGHFPASLMETAKKNNWVVVSMKKDWKEIFSEPQK